jgi:hypothetical protein
MDVARDEGDDDGEAGKASTPRGNLGPVFSSLERLPPISARSWDGLVEEIPSTARCRGAFPSRAAPRHSLLHRPPHSLTPHPAYSRSPLPHPLAASRPARRSPRARGLRFGDAPGPILKLSPPHSSLPSGYIRASQRRGAETRCAPRYTSLCVSLPLLPPFTRSWTPCTGRYGCLPSCSVHRHAPALPVSFFASPRSASAVSLPHHGDAQHLNYLSDAGIYADDHAESVGRAHRVGSGRVDGGGEMREGSTSPLRPSTRIPTHCLCMLSRGASQLHTLDRPANRDPAAWMAFSSIMRRALCTPPFDHRHAHRHRCPFGHSSTIPCRDTMQRRRCTAQLTTRADGDGKMECCVFVNNTVDAGSDE